MKDAVTLRYAKDSGLKHYFTGKPCRNGHVSVRRVSNRTCEDCLRDRTKAWFKENEGYYANYRSKNLDDERRKDRHYYEKNKERISRIQKEYRRNNREKELARRHAAIARKNKAEGRFNKSDIDNILVGQNYQCKYCSADLRDGYQIDHYMPLALGGSNWPENLQCLCQTCNARKSAKHPEDWEREIGLRP